MGHIEIKRIDINLFEIVIPTDLAARKLMKINIFISGMQGITLQKNQEGIVLNTEKLDEYAIGKLLNSLVQFFDKNSLEYCVDDECNSLIQEKENLDKKTEENVKLLSAIKSGEMDSSVDYQSFYKFCDETLCITLRDYQYKSAYLLGKGNGGFDFSVPGAGKTIITYTAYAYMKAKGLIDKVLVIGPSNAYNAWVEEYETCFGQKPDFENLSFISKPNCVTYFNSSEKNHAEIAFINFEKARSLRGAIGTYLSSSNSLLIIDEAHKVKNPTASVTESISDVTKYAKSRIILTGTPMPNGYEDLFALTNIFSPFKEILPYKYAQLKSFTKNGADENIVNKIRDSIRPYYSRISKKYLIEKKELLEPEYKVIKCEMDENQIALYDKLNNFCGKLSDDLDEGLLQALKKATLIRKMQISSNPGLLKRTIISSMDELREEYAQYSDFDGSDINQLSKIDKMMSEKMVTSEVLRAISQYENGKIETPKNSTAVKIAKELLSENKQVLIWDVFVENMRVLRDMLRYQLKVSVEVINGEIAGEERQESIARFRSGESKIMLANPATLAESISLHKVCQNAIYVNRNFNAAQFIQSKDRIHRINMPAGTTATYYFLINSNSVDEAIDERLLLKERRMLAILDADEIKVGGAEMDDTDIMSTEDIDKSYMR